MKKKLVGIFVSMLLFATVLSVAVTANMYSSDFTMTVENAVAMPGENITIPYTGTWSNIFHGIWIKVEFDNTKIQVHGIITDNSVLEGRPMSYINTGANWFMAYGSFPSHVPAGEGTLFYINVSVFQNASLGPTSLNIVDTSPIRPTAYYPIFASYDYPYPTEKFNGVLKIGTNNPPETPDKPDGPTEGVTGEKYTYKTKTIDPDGDQLWYKWNFTDEETDWIGPFDSGAEVKESHTWNSPGIYDVKVKAKDGFGGNSTWSQPLTVTIEEYVPEPKLTIESIAGGKGITTVIKNVGDGDATEVKWKITIDGGFIILTKEESGKIPTIAAGKSAEVNMSVLGFGLGIIFDMPTITVTAECSEGSSADKNATAKILFSYVTIQ